MIFIPILLLLILFHMSGSKRRQRKALAMQRRQMAFAEATYVASLPPDAAAAYLRNRRNARIGKVVFNIVGAIVLFYVFSRLSQ